MLVVAQFPISDARAFASMPTARLDVPDWPDPPTYGNPQFVRRFGPAAERSLGPDAAWTDERVYCHARRAIGFPGLRLARLRAGDVTVRPHIVFRRLFCDRTTAVARVEVGFVAHLAPYASALGPTTVESTVRDLLALDTDVFEPGRGVVHADLKDQGQRLAELFAFATSRRKGSTATPQELDLVRHGRPMVVAEFDQDEVTAFPKNARVIAGVISGDAEIAFFDRLPVPVWLLRRGTVAEPVLRSLRLCLLRLHAERECLDRVLAHLQARRITYQAGTDTGDRLVQYLDDSTKLLEKQRRRGVQQSQLLAAMNAAETAAPPFRTQGMLDRITDVQRQIRVKVERYAIERSGPRVEIEPGGQYVDNRGGVNAPGGVFNAPVTGTINADQISGSFNTVVNSNAAPEVKDAIAELKAAVDALLPQVSEAEGRKVAASFDILAKQAAEPEPVEAIVQAAGSTLVEVGKRVGELAKPIATAINTVLSALKFAAILV